MKILDDGEPYEKFEAFLEEHIQDGRLSFDGIFCVTDRLAFSVIQTLRRLNQRVPQDVQVIGYDASVFLAAWTMCALPSYSRCRKWRKCVSSFSCGKT